MTKNKVLLCPKVSSFALPLNQFSKTLSFHTETHQTDEIGWNYVLLIERNDCNEELSFDGSKKSRIQKPDNKMMCSRSK
jgi:hypothetical protein